jgi:hypothetical protein
MFEGCGIEILHGADWLKAVSYNYIVIIFFTITACMNIKKLDELLH